MLVPENQLLNPSEGPKLQRKPKPKGNPTPPPKAFPGPFPFVFLAPPPFPGPQNSYWRANPIRADRLARSLTTRSGAPRGWAWRLGNDRERSARAPTSVIWTRPPMLISVRQHCRALMIAPSSLLWGDVDHRRALARPLLLIAGSDIGTFIASKKAPRLMPAHSCCYTEPAARKRSGAARPHGGAGQCFGHQVDSSAVSSSGRTASISLRRASRNGGSFRSRPSDSRGSSTVKPGASVAISNRMPPGSWK